MGIPEKWEVYRDHWRKFVKEQRQMLSGSGASLSSWSSASSFDQASGFLNSTKGGSIFGQRTQHIKSDKPNSNASSILTSNGDDDRLGLRYGDGPIKYSWEYLAEGKETRLRKHDGQPSSKEQSGRVPGEPTSMCEDGTSLKNYDSSVVTSGEESNYSLRSTRGQQRRNQEEKRKNAAKMAPCQNNNKPRETAASTNVARTCIPTSPKMLKDLFHVVKNDGRYRASKVGRCIVCSTSYSIPYIERHIVNKHPALILDFASAEGEHSETANLDRSRSTYLRPRVVMTRLDSEKRPNKDHKAKTIIYSEANIKAAKSNTSQTKAPKSIQSSSHTGKHNGKPNKRETVLTDSHKISNGSNRSKQNRDPKTKRETTSKSKNYNMKQNGSGTLKKISLTNNTKNIPMGTKDGKCKKLKQNGNQTDKKENELKHRPKNVSSKKKRAGDR